MSRVLSCQLRSPFHSVSCRPFTLRQTYAKRPGKRWIHRSPHASQETALATRVLVGAVTGLTGLTVLSNLTNSRLLADSGEDESGWLSKPLSFIGLDKFSRLPGDIQRRERSRDEERSSTQVPPAQTRGEESSETTPDSTGSADQDDEASPPQSLFERFRFATIGDAIADAILPAWAKVVPGFIRKIQSELSMAPGSLADEIWQDAHQPEANPEIIWDASVRVSNELCKEETEFLRHRKAANRKALAKYLDVPESQIHPDDIPTIAMCGSGGGLRALVAGTSSYLSAQQDGLFDCVTYTAGVSGSCWLQTLFYSSLGQQDHSQMIQHLKHRLGVHIAFPPPALGLLSRAPTNKFLLSGVVEKLRGNPDADFGLVDIYGLLLGARLLVPKGELGIYEYDLKISNQRQFTDRGENPLPIYTAVRHEIPNAEDAKSSDPALKRKAKNDAWFQWFEWTPYEFFCEELEAGIPTWAVGRHFDQGRTVWRENGLALPEMRVPELLGIWGSAFCATLSHYYKEIKPVIKGLAGFGGLDQLMTSKDEELIKVHPIDPASIPNFALNMREQLPDNCPESIHSATHFALMDAGMSNNLPIYPLLRPGRNVDVVIAFDASADVRKDNWLSVVDGYVKQRGIKGWPLGAGWPTEEISREQRVRELDQAQVGTSEEAFQRVEKARKSDAVKAASDGDDQASEKDLSYCTVWIGTTQEREMDKPPSRSKQVEEGWELTQPNAGIAVIYFPLMANDKVPGINPGTTEYMSTWNFVYTPEEIDKVVDLAKANFAAGKDQTRRTIRAVWQRKRDKRLEAEKRAQERKWMFSMAKGPKEKVYGEQGDHFT